MKRREVYIEKWEIGCLLHYLDEICYKIDEEVIDDGFWYDVLIEAIEHYKEVDGWDFYIYVPPEECGEQFGMTIWYSLLG